MLLTKVIYLKKVFVKRINRFRRYSGANVQLGLVAVVQLALPAEQQRRVRTQGQRGSEAANVHNGAEGDPGRCRLGPVGD